MKNSMAQLSQTQRFLTKRIGGTPQVGIILGSGLGTVARLLENRQEVPYAKIPHFPVLSVKGHSGMLVTGTLMGKTVVIMQGRPHYYEGFSPVEVTYPVRCLGMMGIHTLIITAAAGAVTPRYRTGDVVLLRDHINLMGVNPLRGRHLPLFGERFPDMSDVYNADARRKVRTALRRSGIAVREGVYAAVSGPSYETPAEVKALKILGADVVGMSVVPEAVAARQMGITVIGLCMVANQCNSRPVCHDDVLAAGRACVEKFTVLIPAIIKQVS